jgi:hypothetical protein
MHHEPIHITIAGCPDDPRTAVPPDGVIVHYTPEWHPDDIDVTADGLPITSLARTLVDLAEIETRAELRACFAVARHRGILDLAAVRASAGRVEWRPSLKMLYEVIAEFEAA